MKSRTDRTRDRKPEGFLTRTDRNLAEIFVAVILWPFSLLYGTVMVIRRLLYRLGLFRSERFNSKVISVGGLTLGGAGKTPMVIHLAEMLTEKRLRVLILTRGYGGEIRENLIITPDSEPAGGGLSDEVRLMRRRTRCTIGIGPDRVKSYKAATESGAFDVVLLDDGFQHLAIDRDLDILVLDASHPFGNGMLLPSGNLREPRSTMKYADLVVVAKSNAPNANHEAIVQLISLRPDIPIVTAKYALEGIVDVKSGEGIEVHTLETIPMYAFTSIALPDSFYRTIEEHGLRIGATRAFRDHHIFTRTDVSDLIRDAGSTGCRAFVVTEKDEVKLGEFDFGGIPAYSIRIRLQITSGADSLEKLFAGALNG